MKPKKKIISFNEGIIECFLCKSEKKIKRSDLSKSNKGLFCSKSCKMKWLWSVGTKMKDAVKKTTQSEERNKKISLSKLSEKNPMWKGDKAGYTALHYWIRARLKKPKFCIDCRRVPPRDLANISQKYLRDIKDFEWLCRSCHMKKDGRTNRLQEIRHPKLIKEITEGR